MLWKSLPPTEPCRGIAEPCLDCGIQELFSLEKTSETTRSSCQPSTAQPTTKPCPKVPHLCFYCTHVVFCLQGWSLNQFPGKPALVLDHTFGCHSLNLPWCSLFPLLVWLVTVLFSLTGMEIVSSGFPCLLLWELRISQQVSQGQLIWQNFFPAVLCLFRAWEDPGKIPQPGFYLFQCAVCNSLCVDLECVMEWFLK